MAFTKRHARENTAIFEAACILVENMVSRARRHGRRNRLINQTPRNARQRGEGATREIR